VAIAEFYGIMPNPVVVSVALDALAKKLATLARIAPDEVKGVELLVDDALERHHEEERAKRLAMFSRVK
jgi:hypothetical protein